jgi:hypothetical protein
MKKMDFNFFKNIYFSINKLNFNYLFYDLYKDQSLIRLFKKNFLFLKNISAKNLKMLV